MTSPSTKPAVKVLLSQIALIVDALNDCISMGLENIASITETVPSLGGEDTYVEASTIPRNHPMKFIAIVLDDVGHKRLECEEETQQRERRFYKHLSPPGR
jgi:hypothetical protein